MSDQQIRVFLDLDGVLSHWMKGACELFDLDLENDLELREFLKEHALQDRIGSARMWNGINEAGSDFWANLEPFPWARRLYEELGKFGTVTLLTSPSEALEAPAGKIRWIRQHIKTKNYIITQVKEQCAHSHAILIDDNKQFIDRFAEYGGMTFHFPNALRILDGEVDIDDVISRLCRYLRSKRKFPIY